MSAGRSVGRVGALAAALGVGAGIGAVALLGAGTAWADASRADTASPDLGATPAGPARAARSAQHSASGPAQRVREARPAPAVNRTPALPASAQIAAPRGVSLRIAATGPVLRPGAIVPAPTAPLATANATAQASSGLSVNPSISWDAGVITGTLGATSSQKLSYSVVSGPNMGGKLGSGPLLPLTNFGPGGSFTYIPYSSVLTDASKSESFRIMVLENSKLDQFVEKLLGPLGELLVPQALAIIHRIPIVGDLLSPIIGSAKIVPFTVNPFAEAAGQPTAFTYKMPSFDGTLISVNYFPSVKVANGEATEAPTVLAASGLACAANTDPNTLYGQLFPSQQFGSLTPGIKPLREDSWTSVDGGPSYDGGGGYNVVTWDPRGEFASGGQLQIDNPFFEGRDVSAIITWLTGSANPAAGQVKTSEAGDPLVGMTGGSYGGGIQLTTFDPRLDALVPEIAWNSLISSLYPNQNQFLTGFGSILALALAVTGARVNPAVYEGIITGAITGRLTQGQQAVLASAGPSTLLNQEKAPTLLFQGIHDVLFPLQQAVDNAERIMANPFDTPVKMVWFCGGHGTCTDPINSAQDDRGIVDNLKWLDQHVAGDPDKPADTIPAFQWYDQNGDYWTSDLLPFQKGFNQEVPLTVTGSGGLLGIVPLLGGSGPHPLKDLPFSIANAGPALNALNLEVTPPAQSQIVGAPRISFDYKGLGTARTVYAQLVDNATRLVLGNVVTPIPVVLDGRKHTVTIPMADVVYSAASPSTKLTLQITSSAVNYENFYNLGLIDISNLAVDLPLRAVG